MIFQLSLRPGNVLNMGIQLIGCGFNKIYVKDLPHEEKENFRFGARLQRGEKMTIQAKVTASLFLFLHRDW